MARPKKTLTAEQMVQLEALAAYLTIEQIADYFGFSDDTLRRRMSEDAEVLRAYKKGKQRTVASIANNLVQKAREGDNACMFFFLKTQAGWRETHELDHKSSDGSMSPKRELTREDMERELEKRGLPKNLLDR